MSKLAALAASVTGGEPCGTMAKYAEGRWLVSVREEIGAASGSTSLAVVDISSTNESLDAAVAEVASRLREARDEP